MVGGMFIPLFSLLIIFPIFGIFLNIVDKSRIFLYGSLVLSNFALILISYVVYLYNPIEGVVPVVGFWTNWIFIDGVNLSLLWLTGVIFSAIAVYSFASNIFSIKLYFQLLLLLEYLIIIALLSNHIIVFYLLYETLAVPMFFLIGLVGVRGRKLHAAYLFLFFTLASSILLLTALVIIYQTHYTLFFDELGYVLISHEWQLVIAVLVFVGFAAKIPVVPLHIWLPEAHVEAPTVGSIILAAIFLKFGFYGMYRLILPICCSDVLFELRPFFF